MSGVFRSGGWAQAAWAGIGGSDDVRKTLLDAAEVEAAGEEDEDDDGGGNAEGAPGDGAAEAGGAEGVDEGGHGVEGQQGAEAVARASGGLHVDGGGGKHPHLDEEGDDVAEV